jgi:hypothetical protein
MSEPNEVPVDTESLERLPVSQGNEAAENLMQCDRTCLITCMTTCRNTQ